jgi:prepilin-type N-terminal cleavage/methylation domain-containing protein
MKKILNKKGFTLIELIVVILILAILAAILVPSILNYVTQANTARDQANARGLYSELSLILVTDGELPGSPHKGCTYTGTVINDLVVTCGVATFDGQTLTPTP